MSNVTVTVNQANITVDEGNTNVAVTTTTSNVTVATLPIISNAIVRAALSVTNTGGDGSLAYDQSSGVFTYTGVSAAETRAHFSATAPITLASGVIGIDSNALFTGKTTDDLAEGSTNLYYTNARADARVDLQTGTNLDLSSKSTTDLAEGTNLYYTTARQNTDFDTRLATKSTSDLAEGTNLYFTNSRADARFDVKIAAADTDDLSEGSTNLYYTDARVQTKAANLTGPVTTTANVSSAGFTTTGNATVGLDLNVLGNLEVTGNINYREVEDLLVRDQTITMNFGNASANDVQLISDRSGSALANTYIKWDETADKWKLTNDGSTDYEIVTETYTGNISPGNINLTPSPFTPRIRGIYGGNVDYNQLSIGVGRSGIMNDKTSEIVFAQGVIADSNAFIDYNATKHQFKGNLTVENNVSLGTAFSGTGQFVDIYSESLNILNEDFLVNTTAITGGGGARHPVNFAAPVYLPDGGAGRNYLTVGNAAITINDGDFNALSGNLILGNVDNGGAGAIRASGGIIGHSITGNSFVQAPSISATGSTGAVTTLTGTGTGNTFVQSNSFRLGATSIAGTQFETDEGTEAVKLIVSATNGAGSNNDLVLGTKTFAQTLDPTSTTESGNIWFTTSNLEGYMLKIGRQDGITTKENITSTANISGANILGTFRGDVDTTSNITTTGNISTGNLAVENPSGAGGVITVEGVNHNTVIDGSNIETRYLHGIESTGLYIHGQSNANITGGTTILELRRDGGTGPGKITLGNSIGGIGEIEMTGGNDTSNAGIQINTNGFRVFANASQLPGGVGSIFDIKPAHSGANNTSKGETIQRGPIELGARDSSIFTGIDANISIGGTGAKNETDTAGALSIGWLYSITTTGTTDFTLIGAADSNPGTAFRPTGVGSGTGTATRSVWNSGNVIFGGEHDGNLNVSSVISNEADFYQGGHGEFYWNGNVNLLHGENNAGGQSSGQYIGSLNIGDASSTAKFISDGSFSSNANITTTANVSGDSFIADTSIFALGNDSQLQIGDLTGTGDRSEFKIDGNGDLTYKTIVGGGGNDGTVDLQAVLNTTGNVALKNLGTAHNVESASFSIWNNAGDNFGNVDIRGGLRINQSGFADVSHKNILRATEFLGDITTNGISMAAGNQANFEGNVNVIGGDVTLGSASNIVLGTNGEVTIQSSGKLNVAHIDNVTDIVSASAQPLQLKGQTDGIKLDKTIATVDSKIFDTDTTGYSLADADLGSATITTVDTPQILSVFYGTAGSTTLTCVGLAAAGGIYTAFEQTAGFPYPNAYWNPSQGGQPGDSAQTSLEMALTTSGTTITGVVWDGLANLSGWAIYDVTSASSTSMMSAAGHIVSISGNTVTLSEPLLQNTAGTGGSPYAPMLLIPGAYSSTQNMGLRITGDNSTNAMAYKYAQTAYNEYDLPETLANVTLDRVSYGDATVDMANVVMRHSADIQTGPDSALRIPRAMLIGANATPDLLSVGTNSPLPATSTLGITVEQDGLTNYGPLETIPQMKVMLNNYKTNSLASQTAYPNWSTFLGQSGNATVDMKFLGAPNFNFKLLGGTKDALTTTSPGDIPGRITWNPAITTGFSGADQFNPPASITAMIGGVGDPTSMANVDMYLQSTSPFNYRDGTTTASSIPNTFLASQSGTTTIAANQYGKISLRPTRDYGDNATGDTYIDNRYANKLHDYHTFLDAGFSNAIAKSGTIVNIQPKSGQQFGTTTGFNYDSSGDATLRLSTHNTDNTPKSQWDIEANQASGNLSIINSINSASLENVVNINSVRVHIDNSLKLQNLTTTEINALVGPEAGDTVFNVTLEKVCFYSGSTNGWQQITSATM